MTTQPTQKSRLGFGGHRPAMFLDPSGGALQKPPTKLYLAFTKFSKVRRGAVFLYNKKAPSNDGANLGFYVQLDLILATTYSSVA